MEEIKAIETSYNGIRFRSRLEARWAKFFDEMNIQYEYETEGYILPSGRKYLPDFKLFGFCGRGPQVIGSGEILWCEVKGVQDEDDLYSRKREDYYKVEEFSKADNFVSLQSKSWSDKSITPEELDRAAEDINKIIILPNIPKDSREWWNSSVTQFEFVDFDCWECIITKPYLSDERFVLCGPDGDSYPYASELEITDNALRKARSARFEFTEQDLDSLEQEVKMLERRKQLLDERDELLKQLSGGSQR